MDLHKESKAWADTALGGCFATRYDIDEHGSGVVDVFCAPTREYRGKVRLMANSALRALQKREGERTSYAALQSSWARHCQQHLDPAFQRGDPKSETGHEHIVADRLREAHEAKDNALAAERKDLLESIQDREDAFRDQEATLANWETDLEVLGIQQGAILRKREEALEAREAQLRRRNAEIAARERKEEKRREEAHALAQQHDPVAFWAGYNSGWEVGHEAGQRDAHATWDAWLKQLPEKLRTAVQDSIAAYKRWLSREALEMDNDNTPLAPTT